jgi:hypothetical protein
LAWLNELTGTLTITLVDRLALASAAHHHKALVDVQAASGSNLTLLHDEFAVIYAGHRVQRYSGISFPGFGSSSLSGSGR